MKKTESQETIVTSPTLRRKGEALKKCFINFIKLFRMCGKKKE
jgi:hypothetical protein